LIPPLVFALLLHSQLESCHLNECINSGDDAATSCKNLVNFGNPGDNIAYLCISSHGYWMRMSLLIVSDCTGIPKHVGWSEC